jgi:hypothetical protein
MVALAIACATDSALGIIALRAGGHAALGSVTLLEAAAGYDRAADSALAAERPSPAALRTAMQVSQAAIAQYPYDTQAWVRLAELDRLQHGQLTPAGVAALQRSYDLVGADPDVGVWRISLALENSQALPKSLRASVRTEVATLWTDAGDRNRILDLQQHLQNPAGRLSLALWTRQLQSTAAN